MKKVYTASFKAHVVLEILKETQTIPHLAATYSVAPTVLREWRATARKGLPDMFARRDSTVAMQAAYEQHLEALSGEIGRLTTQVNVFKKRVPTYAMRNGGCSWILSRMRSRSAPRPPCLASVAAVCTIIPNRHRRRRWRSNTY